MMRIGTGRRAWLNPAVLLGMLGSALSANADVVIDVGSAKGVAGGTAKFEVVLITTAGEQVEAVGNTITFDPLTPIASCAINPLLFPTWSLQPPGCTALVNCTHANFISLGQQLGGPIPNGTTLYVCTVNIASNAGVGSYPLTCSDASAGDVDRNPLQVQCPDGHVEVVLAPTPTPTATPVPGGGGGGGGCRIASVCQSYTGLLLMVPAVLLWLRRRRSRL
jgi:hypothetical protein